MYKNTSQALAKIYEEQISVKPYAFDHLIYFSHQKPLFNIECSAYFYITFNSKVDIVVSTRSRPFWGLTTSTHYDARYRDSPPYASPYLLNLFLQRD